MAYVLDSTVILKVGGRARNGIKPASVRIESPSGWAERVFTGIKRRL